MKCAGITLFVGVLGCTSQPGQAYDCACGFLTDFDDKSSIVVGACAAPIEGDEGARVVARSCAQSGAPAPIDSCTCRPLADAAPCEIGACSVR